VEFRLFVYGTLRHGLPAHERYCAGVLRLTRARMHGRLYEHDDGYPVLLAPFDAIFAIGTSDAIRDARTADAPPSALPARPRRGPGNAMIRGPAWVPPSCASLVHGEVLAFDARRVPLSALDEYEGFRPGMPSFFVRVLTEVELPCSAAVLRTWCYIGGPLMARGNLVTLPSGSWRR
jgi:gamma-glutamylcyclotransferase (GGCT)/AIG2-like uncharacterized protein YtfP